MAASGRRQTAPPSRTRSSTNAFISLLLTAWKWIVTYWNFLTIKVIPRAMTGMGQIERLLSSRGHDADMTTEFSRLVFSSKILPTRSTKQGLNVITALSSPKPFDVKTVAMGIVVVKEMQTTRPKWGRLMLPNMLECLRGLSGVNYALSSCERLRKEAFDPLSDDHEDQLERLWAALRPGVLRAGRISEDWKTVGFQGTDPATDFRGMGMLGLAQLIFLATHYPQQSAFMLRNAMDERHAYPLAITGINITHYTLSLLEARRLDRYFFRVAYCDEEDRADLALTTFHQIYVDLFKRFDKVWVKSRPPNLLAFTPIFERFKKETEQQIVKGECEFMTWASRM